MKELAKQCAPIAEAIAKNCKVAPQLVLAPLIWGVEDLLKKQADALERLTADLADVTSMYNRLVDDVHAARTERDLALERGAEYSEQVAKQDLKIERLTAELGQAPEIQRMLMADCKRLTAERDAALAASRHETDLCQQALEDLEKVTAERDALRADAERYEFLRNNFATKSEDSVDDFIALEPMTGDCFDAHIDLLIEEFERAKK